MQILDVEYKGEIFDRDLDIRGDIRFWFDEAVSKATDFSFLIEEGETFSSAAKRIIRDLEETLSFNLDSKVIDRREKDYYYVDVDAQDIFSDKEISDWLEEATEHLLEKLVKGNFSQVFFRQQVVETEFNIP